MSILFATPCYANSVTGPYLQSMVRLGQALQQVGLDHDFLFGWNESLIQRARNKMAASFMKTDFKKLMWIDSDIEFKPDDVAALWNLDADIAAGVYPMKHPGSAYAAWVDGQLVFDLDQYDGPIEADYAGTGFMMIDRRVLQKMKREWPERIHAEGEDGDCFAWFDPRVEDYAPVADKITDQRLKDVKAERIYLSEDYAFCHDAKKIGFNVMVDPSIRLKHYGLFGYGSE